MRFTRLLVVAGFLLLGTALALFWLIRPAKSLPPGSIPVLGGEKLDLSVSDDAIHFRQADPRWAGQTIGGSGESVGAVGCTLCSVAMAFSRFGIETDPSLLNADLIGRNGYTKEGWIQWSAVEAASAKRVAVTVHESPSHAIIDEDLKSGRLTLAKFILPLGIPHWVLICGKQGTDYLILDPALRSGKPIRFSQRSDSIVALRTLSLRPNRT